MIGTLPADIKYHWQDHVNMLVHAYNCMDFSTTKFSPFYLMFGREPSLPTDIEFGVRTPVLIATSTKSCLEKLQKRLAWAFRKTQEVNEKENKRNKNSYDRKVKYSKLEIRDKVLLRQKAFKGKHKIQDKWEDGIYEVISQPIKFFPVFTVQHGGTKKLKTLHRNMLFPLGQELQCEDKSHKVQISGPLQNHVNTEMDSDEEGSINDEAQECKGPVTRAKTKGLAQAKMLMARDFDT